MLILDASRLARKGASTDASQDVAFDGKSIAPQKFLAPESETVLPRCASFDAIPKLEPTVQINTPDTKLALADACDAAAARWGVRARDAGRWGLSDDRTEAISIASTLRMRAISLRVGIWPVD